MELWLIIATAFWLIAPAYAANAFAPLAKGKRPLDFGKSFRGKRILGDGKTFEGTIAGIIFGIFLGSLLMYVQGFYPNEMAALGFVVYTLPLIILLSVGAIAGDIAGAFIKRRFGIERGAPAPLLDQLDFVIGALFFAGFIYLPEAGSIIFLLLITPIIHWIANLIGYAVKVKKTPW